ncbi:MAG: RNA 2',3'-cyclic phosphodiesterase [Dehalococcoidia bacterium]
MAESREPALRLFVACPLPAAALEALAAAQRQLQQAGAPPLRWVRPQGIHLTLKFLGDVSQERTTAVADALAQAVVGLPPFTLALAGLGTFGDRRGPRVVWIDVAGEVERLAEAQRRVETAMATLGFPSEGRPFSPHLTLARVPEGLPPPQRHLLAQLVRQVEPPAAAAAISRVCLIRSILERGGAIYQELATFSLSH